MHSLRNILSLVILSALLLPLVTVGQQVTNNKGGLEFDHLAASERANVVLTVGEEKCFTLTAKDRNNNVIRDWNNPAVGVATTITIMNSQANTDSSTISWNADPLAYTWAELSAKRGDGTKVLLTKVTDNVYSIPQDLFEDGVATVCFIDTKAENDVYLEVTTPAPYNTAMQNSVHMDFQELGIDNYLVEITSAVPGEKNKIYKMRKYEIVVTPRDKYLNTSYAEIRSQFSARFPGEFDNSIPNLSDIFSGDVFIKANTQMNFFLASRIARMVPNQRQRIAVFSSNTPTIRGESDEFEILDHAPKPFNLLMPPDQTNLALMTSALVETFTWQQSVDPYENIQPSPRFNPTEIVSDQVTYSIHFVDSISLARSVKFDSYNLGQDTRFVINHQQLADIVTILAGSPQTLSLNVFWRVEATDGLYVTNSLPFTSARPGHSLHLDKQGISAMEGNPLAQAFALEQNHPNPFNPTTTLTYTLPQSCKVTVVIRDVQGTLVKTLVDAMQGSGMHSVTWNATNEAGAALPSGIYHASIVAGEFAQTRSMTLLK